MDIKDQFVTYKIALKLKEVDFDEISRFGTETSLYDKSGNHIFYSNYGFMNSGLGGDYIYAPLWQQAIDWFREHNLYLEIQVGFDRYYFIWRDRGYEFSNELFCIEEKSYKKAREQAILKAIELCKNNLLHIK